MTLVARHGIPLALALSLLWLTQSFGGYHARTWGLWTIVMCAACIVGTALLATRGVRLGRWAIAGISALLGLAAVSGLSIRWATYSPHESWDEAGRIVMYAVAVALGAMVVALSGRLRPLVGWLVMATAATAAWTLVKLNSDERLTLFVSGRLDAPVGYSNATAALYFVAMWFAIGLAMSADRRAQISAMKELPALGVEFWALGSEGAPRQGATSAQIAGWAATSAAFTALASMFAGLGLLTQSRGAAIALVISFLAAIALGPMRINIAARVGGIAIAAIAAREKLGAPYQDLTALNRIRAVRGDDAAALEQALRVAQDAGSAVLAMGFVGLIVGVVIFVGSRLSARLLSPTNLSPSPYLRIAVAVFAVVAVGGTLAANQSATRTPATWITNQVEACRDISKAPGIEATESHFSTVGTNRCDFWRVAWVTFADNPLLGVGANNFSGPYAKLRKSTELPQQAHSLPLDVLAGVGVLGGVLFLAAGGALLIPLALMARTGWARDPVLVGAGAAAAYWMTQSSLDWLWNVPAVTIPVLATLGAVATQVRPRDQRQIADPTRRRIPLRAALIAGAGSFVLCLALVLPLQQGDIRLRQARDSKLQRSDPNQSLKLAAEAAQWQPVWATPVIFQAALLLKSGQQKDATRLAKLAVQREPGNWYVHYQAAQITTRSDPAFSKRSSKRAAQLNPGA